MFDSKSPLVKIVSYAVTGFFVLIIVISFGMPDFVSRLGLDQSAVAVVNGERVSRYDYLRYRDSRFGEMPRDEKMDAMILSYYINEVLFLQEARKTGLYVTDESVKDYIRAIPGLRNPETGDFDGERLDLFLQRLNMTFNDLQKAIRKDLLRDRFLTFIRMGIAAPSADIRDEHVAATSRLRIKYSFVSAMDLGRRVGNLAPVTEQDITAEMEKNRGEMKDPVTDRERIRKKLESAGAERVRKDIVDRVNAIALRGGTFDEAQGVLKGTVAISGVFAIGDRVADERGQTIAAINGSPVFLEEFMQIEMNRTSRVISSDAGLYIFTPVMKDISRAAPSEREREALATALQEESLRMMTGNLMQKVYENAKIVKNIKTD